MTGKFFFVVLSILFCNFLNAQLSAVGYKSEAYEQFEESTTYVLITGEPIYDANMKEAMKEWKITPVGYVTEDEFGTKISDKGASFILPITIITGTSGQQYNFIALLNGGKKKLIKYDYTDMLAYGVVNHFGNEKQNTDCAFRLSNIISSMIQSMELVKKNELRGYSKFMVDELMKYYRTQSYKIPKRTLLVNAEAIGNKITEEEFGKIYPYKFEFCSQRKIAEVVKERNSKYYYFQPAITLNKSMFVFDPATGEVVYGDYQTMGLNINKKNVEMLTEAIAGK
jgi:hypothetical protein